ncbi:hypothetical protein DSO57_1034657 [Entomophthora muscae]|uniref:Uncharacterized protein n=1 Tax=Entomophthora muscae TaxID=34485 RepID=A0ACC2TYH1_9FUNG|nr:hypothetical protein DSO57_1034657 [Entomophthora muscae]
MPAPTTAEKRPADDSEEFEEGPNKRFQGEEEENEPHRVLYVENLPLGVTDEVVAYLFQQYSGFKEVRMVPGRPDLAFVEFELAQQAAIAKEILNGFKVTTEYPMKITFAKK